MAYGGYDPDLEELLLALTQGAHGGHGGGQPDFAAPLPPMQQGPRPLPFGPPQGRQVGGLFVASNPLESLAYGLAGMQQGKTGQAQQQAMAQRRQQLVKALGGGPEVEALLSGDPAAAAAGQFVAKSRDERENRLLQRALAAQKVQADEEYRRQQLSQSDRRIGLDTERLKLEREKSGQDAWSAIADPVTGGIVLYNKKTRETMPLGPGGGQPPGASPGPLPGIPGKPTENQRTKVLGASESISQLDMAIEALKKAPGAYGGVGNFVAGLAEAAGGTPAQSIMSRRYSPEELKVKNYVSNVVSKIINERAGANVTLREELRQKFLPQDTDSLENAQQKLVDLRQMMSATYRAQGGSAVPDPGAPGAAVRKFIRGADGKIVEVK